MEVVEPQDGYSVVTIPLLLGIDEKQHQHHKDECDESAVESYTAGTTSFFKTCFNGLNALSGSLLLLVYIYIYIHINLNK